MHITESIGLAWTGIRSNKFRSFLTMLGMIIGVAAVIAMISIGDGAKESIVDSISGLGTGTITLSGGSGQMRLELDDAYYLLERSPSSSMMYPSSSSNGSVKAGTSTENYTIVGTTPEYSPVQDWGVQSGSFLLQEHIDQRNTVAVIGETVSEELFEGRDPVGEKIRINGDVFEVIGVMTEKGTSMGMSTDNQVFIPITTAQRMQGSRYVSQVTFQLTDSSLNKLAMAEINVGLEEIFGDVLLRDNPFNLMSMDDVMNVMDSALSTLTYLLAGIAGISLLVGGIGIMNIMLVSVTERTREIGIRKALGARYSSILSQFLIEAVIISLTGGAIGLTLGSLASNLVAGIAGWSQGVSSSAIILALGFSIGVGIFFGVYPANKAAKMDPIDALRYQ